jgi:LytTr DNA-binding domain
MSSHGVLTVSVSGQTRAECDVDSIEFSRDALRTSWVPFLLLERVVPLRYTHLLMHARRTPVGTPDGSDLRRAIAFCVLTPMVLGLFIGWMQPGRTAEWPKSAALLYVGSIYLAPWLLADLATRGVARLTRPHGFGLLTVLLLGYLTAIPFMGVMGRSSLGVVMSLYPGIEQGPPLPGYPWESQFSLTRLFDDVIPGVILWLGANVFLFRVLRWPRYGFAAAADPVSSTEAAAPRSGEDRPIASTAIVQGLKLRLTNVAGPILALEAEEHYVRVHAATRTELVLYRFSDAVAEMASNGIQIHRSWWVADAAVLAVRADSRNTQVELSNGQLIPVSRTFKRQVSTRGWPNDGKLVSAVMPSSRC